MKSLIKCHTIEEVADQVNERIDNGEPVRAEAMAVKYAIEAVNLWFQACGFGASTKKEGEQNDKR